MCTAVESPMKLGKRIIETSTLELGLRFSLRDAITIQSLGKASSEAFRATYRADRLKHSVGSVSPEL